MLINKQQFCNVNFDPVDRNPSLNKKKTKKKLQLNMWLLN